MGAGGPDYEEMWFRSATESVATNLHLANLVPGSKELEKMPPFTPEVHAFAARAISDCTRKTYAIAQGQYRAYCARTKRDPGAGGMTPQSVASFIADLGARARHLPATIRTYRSALSTMWLEHTLGEGGADNPSHPSQWSEC